MFSKHVRCMELNEVEVVAILEFLWIFVSLSLQVCLIVESDSYSISWVSSLAKFPWRFQFYFTEITSLSSLFGVKFQNMRWSANGFADSLAKQGVGRSSDLVAFPL